MARARTAVLRRTPFLDPLLADTKSVCGSFHTCISLKNTTPHGPVQLSLVCTSSRKPPTPAYGLLWVRMALSLPGCRSSTGLGSR